MTKFHPIIAVIILACVACGCERSAPLADLSVVESSSPGAVRQQTPSTSSIHPPASVSDREPASLLEPPDPYLAAHLKLLKLDSPEWQESAALLRTQGNQFTLSIIRELRTSELTQTQDAMLDELSNVIASSHSETELGKQDVQLLLETAAYADLMCHALEHPLRNWTLEFIGKHKNSPEIRAELERIRDSYKSQLGTETLFDAMDNRVPLYAKKLLAKSASEH